MKNYTDTFIFNGISSETFNLIICDAPAVRTVKASSKSYKFNKTSGRNNYSVSNSYYNQQLEIKFTVAKPTFEEFDQHEERLINRWLDVDDFSFLSFCDFDLRDIYYSCVCTGKEWEVINGTKISCELTFTADSPFGYTEERIDEITVDGSNVLTIYNDSDEFEKIIPYVQIQITDNCDFTILNRNSNELTKFTNCVRNEIITMDIENCELSSTERKTVVTNFNKVWLGLYNSDLDYGTENILSFTGNGVVLLKYRFIRKVVAL